MWKMLINIYLDPKLMCSNDFFCPTDSTDVKDYSFTLIYGREEQQAAKL